MSAPWDGIIPQETAELYRRAGFGKPRRGAVKPALLIIDTQYATTGEHPMPPADAISYHPLNCGEHAWQAISNIVPLLCAFREAGRHVIYAHSSVSQLGGQNSRWPALPTNARFFQIVEEIAPRQGDILLPKTAPSAFFGTPLVRYLNTMHIDTLFIVGNTTSGCIRASVTDAVSYDYNVIVPHDACYDRSPISHAVNLFDIASKYADVMTTDEAIGLLKSIR